MPRRKYSPFQKLAEKLVPDFTQQLKRFTLDPFSEAFPLLNSPKVKGSYREKSPKVKNLRKESWYRDKLALTLGGQTEVQTPDGRVDIVTPTEIIEVKTVQRWKHALGQILVYGQYYPFHRKRIHLYGEISKHQLMQVGQQCRGFGVTITLEE